jgi:hypothetical protein
MESIDYSATATSTGVPSHRIYKLQLINKLPFYGTFSTQSDFKSFYKKY